MYNKSIRTKLDRSGYLNIDEEVSAFCRSYNSTNFRENSDIKMIPYNQLQSL